MASLELDEIDFEDQYDKADTIDDADLDASMTLLNESIREQEELEIRIHRTEWSSMDKNDRTKLEQQIALNKEKQSLYVMRASKTILSILHGGFDKMKQDGRVMVLDEKSAERLYNQSRLVESDEGTYKIVFESESGTYKDILSSGNRWLAPDAYLRIFGKKFIKNMGFDVDKPKSGTKSKIPKKRMEQIKQYVDEIDNNTKQFTRELNELPTNEDNRDNIMLQDIITKNEIATDNSMKLTETSLTEIGGVEASTQTSGLTLRELEGLDKEWRMISGSLRLAIAKSVAKQVDIDKENKKLEEMTNDETYSDEQREEVRARLQRFQDEQKAINDQIRILKGRYSNQIYQIRESIMKFLDKETGTLGERIRTLFKEQGITIVSILTALGMTLGVLIEALLGGPSTTSTPTSESTTTSDKKGGAREWIKNNLKALSQLLGKLADKALASLPGIIGSIISWILNRAKEVVVWLSQNLWALITGVGVLIYTYFMTKTRRR